MSDENNPSDQKADDDTKPAAEPGAAAAAAVPAAPIVGGIGKPKSVFAMLPPWAWAALLAIAFTTSYLSERFPRHSGDKVVVLDTKALLDAKSAQVASSGKMDIPAEEFVKRLRTIAQRYSDSGYIILNAGYVVYWPDSLDITGTVAEELGIDLSARNAAQQPRPPAQSQPAQPAVAPAPSATTERP